MHTQVAQKNTLLSTTHSARSSGKVLIGLQLGGEVTRPRLLPELLSAPLLVSPAHSAASESGGPAVAERMQAAAAPAAAAAQEAAAAVGDTVLRAIGGVKAATKPTASVACTLSDAGVFNTEPASELPPP